MNLDAELVLSYYKEIAEINNKHRVMLVQHVETGSFYVKKTLSVFNFDVYRYLKAHPLRGLPQIFEIVKDGGDLVVIEEYIAGDSLRSVLDKNGPLSEARTIELIGQLCDILAALHAVTPPIVHRDIKPSNLIVSGDGALKLIDFNAAKLVSAQGTQDTVLMGTAGYAAPEQYGFAASSTSTDIYALGVLMNEMLTGKLPSGKLYAGKLAPVIKKCLQLDAKNRFASVKQLKKALMNSAPVPPAEKTDVHDSWLPPGFRSKKPGRIVLAVLLYVASFALSLSLEAEAASAYELWLNRIFCLLIFMTIIFFAGNYRGIQAHFPLTRSASKSIRVWGIVLWSAVILAGYMTILVLITE